MRINLDKLIGLVGLVTSCMWIILSLIGLFAGLEVIASVDRSLNDNLDVALESLDVISDSLKLSQDIIGNVNDTLTQAEAALVGTSVTISDTRPFLENTSRILDQDVREALSSAQQTMPNAIQALGIVDSTLSLLSKVRLNVLEVEVGLGVDYAPEAPLDDAFREINADLENIPGDLHDLSVNIDTANDNLSDVSERIQAIANDLNTVNRNLADVKPLLDDYIVVVKDTRDLLQRASDGLYSALSKIRWALVGLAVLMCLTQIMPIYISVVFVYTNSGQSIISTGNDPYLEEYPDVEDFN